MRIHLASASLGFAAALAAIFGGFFALFWSQGGSRPLFHDQVLASGKTVKVASFLLTWGVEHDERRPGDDQLSLEYVSAFADGDDPERQKEVWEVFELMRETCERWGFTQATVSAFPSTERKGRYDIYSFRRAADGAWTADRKQAKVFANDP